MKRPIFSVLTAAMLLLGAVVWIATGSVVGTVAWLAFALIFLGIAVFQFATHQNEVVAHPKSRLVRRISRFVLFWT